MNVRVAKMNDQVMLSKTLRNGRTFGLDLTNLKSKCKAVIGEKDGKKLTSLKNTSKNARQIVPRRRRMGTKTVINIDTPKKDLKPKWDDAILKNQSIVDESCTEYIDNIMKHMYDDERASEKATINVWKEQKQFKERYRFILVDWLVSTHQMLKLSPITLHLGIHLLDKYIETNTLKKIDLNMKVSQLQLNGCVCLWIASKYHEIYPAELANLVFLMQKQYSVSQILKAEENIFKVLNFRITVPTMLTFSERFLQIIKYYVDLGETPLKLKTLENMTHYCLEVLLSNYDIVSRYEYSKIAAAVFIYVAFGSKLVGQEQFDTEIKNWLKYDVVDLMPILESLHSIVADIDRKKYKALYAKYQQPSRNKVSRSNYESFIKNIPK